MKFWPFSRRASSSAGRHPGDPALVDWLIGRADEAPTISPREALGLPSVFAPIRLLAQTISTVPLDLYRRGPGEARERATDHPLHGLLHDRPNDWQTSATWRADFVTNLLAYGNGFSRVVRPGDARAIEPMHPTRTWAVRLPSGEVAYRYQPRDGTAIDLGPDEVLHVGLAPYCDDGLVGASPIRLHQPTIKLAWCLDTYLRKFFQNGAAPKGGIKVGTILKEEAAQRLRESFEARHRGPENANKIAIFDGGMDWVSISNPNDQSQVAELRRATSADIASRIYGVPPHLVGDTEKATSWGSGIEQMTIGFVVYSVRPYLTMIEQALNKTLLSREAQRRHYFEFNVDGLLRGDFKTRMEGHALAIQWGIATPNEVRRKENLVPLAGGDQRLQPLNMVPADLVKQVLLRDPAAAKRFLEQILDQEYEPDARH